MHKAHSLFVCLMISWLFGFIQKSANFVWFVEWSCRWRLGKFSCALGFLLCPRQPRHRSSLSLSATERWHVEALATTSSPGVMLWTGVFPPAFKLCPSSRLILQTVFWQLKCHLSSDRDSSYTHTSTPTLSVPLLSSHDPPNAFRMWEMAKHRGENECLSQDETIRNALQGRMWGGGCRSCFFLICFPISTEISPRKSLGIGGTSFGKMTPLQISGQS